MQEIKTRYYTVNEIRQLEHCGRDKAYELAKQLEHEKRGRDIYVFVDSYEQYFNQKRQKAKLQKDKKLESNVYRIRKFS